MGVRLRGGRRVGPGIHPNVGLAVEYRRRLERLLTAMERSIVYWVSAQWRANTPHLARDASPADELRGVMRRLARRWENRFEELAPQLAEYFATAVDRRSKARLASILADAGFIVPFRTTPAIRDVIKASVADNVALIKSIPGELLTDLEGEVMRSVMAGGDLGRLTTALRAKFGIASRRAGRIALHQNNMMTASITRVRQEQAGIDEAVWVHSHAGKTPRPTHLANDGKVYKVGEGWFDPDPEVRKRIWPGQLVGCRCFSRPVLKGF